MTRYLLSGDVLAELDDPEGDPAVHRWVASLDDADLCLCATTLFTLQRGFERRRRLLSGEEAGYLIADEAAFVQLREAFAGRILCIGEAEAILWGSLVGGGAGAETDMALAAVALFHGLVLVTLRPHAFGVEGLRLLDPSSRPRTASRD